MFNASKSQLLCFGKNEDQAHTVKFLLRTKYEYINMNIRILIPYTEKCIHLP